MSRATYFLQDCPTCGRPLRVRVEYLGKSIACQHCGGEFFATSNDGDFLTASDSGENLLERADQLLATADQFKLRPR